MTVWPDVKLNLGLRVLRKRPDGFHELETLFVPCGAFHDELTVTPAGATTIEITNCDWDPQKDLTIQAWMILKSDFPQLPCVKIQLKKNSPVGAGLGGGSADAAYMLKALNTMFCLGLSDPQLAAYASRLGSDCPFFVYDRPMLGTGRGEILEPFDIDLSAYDIRVAVPEGVHVSTKEAYSGIRPSEEGESVREVLALPPELWRGRLVNDFEASVFPEHPEIAALKEKFYTEGAVYSSMTGSGSAVFGIFVKTI